MRLVSEVGLARLLAGLVWPALAVALQAQPVNDNFANRITISGANATITATSFGGTLEAGEPEYEKWWQTNSVWWSWTAPSSGLVRVSYDPYPVGNKIRGLHLYTGATIDALAAVPADPDGGITEAGVQIFRAIAGVAYHLSVVGDGPSSGGEITFALQMPGNDPFAHRIALAGLEGTSSGDSTFAMKEEGEENHAGNAGGKSVWWTWHSRNPALVTVSTTGSAFDTLLAVYSYTYIYSGYGNYPSSRVPVASDDNGGGEDLTSRLTFLALADTEYAIALDGANGAAGAFALSFEAKPANDSFGSRSIIQGTYAEAKSFNQGATKESAEPAHAGDSGGKSVWWSWTAPLDGSVTIATFASSGRTPLDSALAVYTGEALDSLSLLAANHDPTGNGSSTVTFNATTGVTYQIAVDGFGGAEGDIDLVVKMPPVNDQFANRIMVSGTSLTITGANFGATREAGEPNYADPDGTNSVWWSWTAPSSGLVTLTESPRPHVYTGATIRTLTAVPADPEGGITGTEGYSVMVFRAVAGTTYHFVAVGGGPDEGGIVTMQLRMPGNDLIAERFKFDVTKFTSSGDSTFATKEEGEENHAGNGGGKSVWWEWRASNDALVTVSTAGSAFDTMLAVYSFTYLNFYTAGPLSRVLVASNDNGNGGALTSKLTFFATAGKYYALALDGANGASGAFTLSLQARPPNDDFASRSILTGANAIARGFNIGATKQSGEPAHAGNSGGKSVWWSWTAPIDGPATVATREIYFAQYESVILPSSFDTTLAVYTGETVNTLSLVAGNHDPAGSGLSLVTFNASAGVTYQIAVDGFGGAEGSLIRLEVNMPPANDNFAQRISLTGAPVSTTGFNNSASMEAYEPVSTEIGGGHSVWWSWTAPTSGTVSFNTAGSEFPTTLGVYRGTAVNTLMPVVQDKDFHSGGYGKSQVTFYATAGETYQLAVDGKFTYVLGFGGISLNSTPVVASDPPPFKFFDWQSYLAANPNLVAGFGSSPATAWNHYINYGVFEGRNDGDFDVWAYLRRYPDLAAIYGSDLRAAALHWYTVGRAQGLRIPTGFDVTGYFARNADVAALYANDKYGAWLHYWNYGLFEGRTFDANFIAAEYLELNTDVKAVYGADLQAAVMHWFQYGHPIEDRMGRVPIGFDVDNYLARYLDLAAAFGGITPKAVRNVTVWTHYVNYGVLEGRSDGDFEAYNYLATNADLAAVFGSDVRGAAYHWYFYGRREGRRVPSNFDVQNYRTLYPDVVMIFGDDLYGTWLHYRDNGINEGRVFDNLFRVDEYLALNTDVAAVVSGDRKAALLHWLFYGKAEGRPGRY